jgi:tetratricopeptide (TPR) repeat protein
LAEDASFSGQTSGQSARFGRLSALSPLVLAAALLAVVLVFRFIAKRSASFSRASLRPVSMAKIDSAILSVQQRLKEDPQDVAALVEVGILHFEKGRDAYPEAINELEQARELGALDGRLFYALGTMYQEVGLYPFAIQEYKRFLRHYPEDKEVRMLEAKLLYQQGNYADAIAEYERLKYLRPKDAMIEENLGLSLWAAKFYDRAELSFERLAAMKGDFAARAEFYLGQMYLEKKDAKGALDHLLKCVVPDSGPDLGVPREKLYAARATAFEKIGNLAGARDSWRKVSDLIPADAQAKASFRRLDRLLSSQQRGRGGKRRS